LPNTVGGGIIVTCGMERFDFDMGNLHGRGAFRHDF
jgi:hypothetical protein